MKSNFRTVVDVPDFQVKLSYKDSSLWIGSCFTENIGGWIHEMKFPSVVNPFGTIFNPASINQNIERLLEGNEYGPVDIEYANGLHFSFNHHTFFSHSDAGQCLEKINNSYLKASEFLLKSRFLFLTYGTAWIYRLKETGRIVANCHKLPHKIFERKMLSVEEITLSCSRVFEKIKQHNPKVQIVLSVSPVRHFKDGALQNQVSKSALILAVSNLQRQFDFVHYFPAYEIVMDDLRDYRFYEEDMIHPNKIAIRYIMEKFRQAVIDPSANPLLQEVENIRKAVAHRPLNNAGEELRRFLENAIQQCEKIEIKHPYINFNNEIELLRMRLPR